jgi:hypothetical protein
VKTLTATCGHIDHGGQHSGTRQLTTNFNAGDLAEIYIQQNTYGFGGEGGTLKCRRRGERSGIELVDFKQTPNAPEENRVVVNHENDFGCFHK